MEQLAAAANVSVEVIKAAVEQRQRILEAELYKESLNKNTLVKDTYELPNLSYTKPSRKPVKKYTPSISSKGVHKVNFCWRCINICIC